MEVDTGASVSIMCETLYRKLWPRRGLNTTTIRLSKVLSGANWSYGPLVVVKGDGPTLLGILQNVQQIKCTLSNTAPYYN